MPKAYRGDIGMFRSALWAAGFRDLAEGIIFNDDRKCKPKLPGRRLKLWFAGQVFNASHAQQVLLEDALRNCFGDRIITMYFTQTASWLPKSKSLCIKLNS
jgi:hypothetical protein